MLGNGSLIDIVGYLSSDVYVDFEGREGGHYAGVVVFSNKMDGSLTVLNDINVCIQDFDVNNASVDGEISSSQWGHSH